MADQIIHVCFFSRDVGLAEVIARTLGAGFETRAIDKLQANQLAELREWCDILLLDLRAASTQGEMRLGLMDEVKQVLSDHPLVVLCDIDDRAFLASVMERGAYDSVTNPPNMIELRLVLRRAYKSHTAEKELQRMRAGAGGNARLFGLLGTSPAMRELFALAQKIAPCDVNVLITGETGAGKSVLTRAIHQMSARASGPFVSFCCSNMPETLIEDELFGHERGAFTGALMSRRGRLEAADHGTLFLDEIGDLSLGLQPKLLHALQERNFERLGSNTTINVDIRLICATHRNLAEMVQQGRFREDLYYRLNVVQMHLPPLRERRDDIPLLAQLFLQNSAQQFKKKAKRFSQLAMSALEEYNWPGNVRELENAVQRAVVLSEGHTVDVWQLPTSLRSRCEAPLFSGSYEEEVRQFKRRLILRTLRECGWKKAESARALGVARGYLHRLINQLGIQQAEEDPSVEGPEESPPTGRIM